jgi:hypothetical protein
MPMNFSQLGALVDRARQKPPPVVSVPRQPVQRVVQPRRVTTPVTAKPPQLAIRPAASEARPSAAKGTVRPRQAVDAPPASSTVRSPRAASVESLPQTIAAAPPPEPTTAEPDDFPIGWELSKESWHFHRRFFRIFRRPMRCGEYSHLVGQIRHRKAERLWEDCWRVTLPWGRPLLVRGNGWRLITILPRDWQPPQLTDPNGRTEPSLSQDPQALLQPVT